MLLAFSFALFALVGVECIAASRFSVSRKVAILINTVVSEGRKITREDVVVAELPVHTWAVYCYSSTAVQLAVQFFCCL